MSLSRGQVSSFAAALFVALYASQAMASSNYEVTNLGLGAGWAINDSGQVAGWSQDGATRAFLFTPGSGTVQFDLGFATSSLAYGLNNAGQVTGYRSYAGSGGEVAYIYSAGTGI